MNQTLSSKSEDKEHHQLLVLSTNKRGEARGEKKPKKLNKAVQNRPVLSSVSLSSKYLWS